jgi:hypothetical protein
MSHSLRVLKWVLPPLLVFTLLADHALAGGDSLHVVILSPRVGETIDRTEKARYHLFGSVSAFESARVFQIDSGRCRLMFTLMDRAGVQRESTAVLRMTEVFSMSEVIDNIEEIEKGRYAVGSSAATIWVDGHEIVRARSSGSPVGRRSASSDGWSGGTARSLPLGEPSGPQPRSMQYIFSIGAGVNFHTGNIDCIESMYSEIESRYTRAGYPVQGDPAKFSISPRLVIVLLLRPFESLSFMAEVSPPPSEGDLRIGYFSGFVDYRVPLVRSARVCWQVGLGFSLFSIDANRKYGDVRISPVDTVKGYYMLDRIEAAAHPAGISAQTGIVLVASRQSEFLFYVRNTWCSQLNVGLADGSVATLRFTDFLLGIRFTVGLY